MTDFLHFRMADARIGELPTLTLAYIGDGVYELMTRLFLSAQGNFKAGTTHKKAIAIVCAEAQSEAADTVYPLLTEEEEAVFRRGRNAKPKYHPGHTTLKEYSSATALETLFGWLYLKGNLPRLNELFAVCVGAEGAEKQKQVN